MKVVRGSINKMRIYKSGMTVIARRLNIRFESVHIAGKLMPRARFCSGGAVVKIVIDKGGRMVLVDLRPVQGYQAAGPRIDDVVGKNIVRHVPLHLELTGAGSRRVVAVKRVVDDRAVLGVSPLRRITTDGNARSVAVINKVIPSRDEAGGAVFVLTSQLDAKIHIVNDVLFDQDSGAAIHVNAVGRFIVAVCRVAARGDVVNQIAAYYSIASLVDGRIRRRALKANDVDSDVVIVVDNIVRNSEVRNVPVHYQRLARTGLEVMNFIAVNDQIGDGSLGIGAVDSNTKPVAAASGSIAAGKILLNMMDIVFEQFYVGAGSNEVYAQWTEPMFGGVEVANFKTLDPYVTPVLNRSTPCLSEGVKCPASRTAVSPG